MLLISVCLGNKTFFSFFTFAGKAICLPVQSPNVQLVPKGMPGARMPARSIVLGNPNLRERLSSEREQEIICALDSLLGPLCGAVKSKLGCCLPHPPVHSRASLFPGFCRCVQLSSDIHTISNHRPMSGPTVCLPGAHHTHHRTISKIWGSGFCSRRPLGLLCMDVSEGPLEMAQQVEEAAANTDNLNSIPGTP